MITHEETDEQGESSSGTDSENAGDLHEKTPTNTGDGQLYATTGISDVSKKHRSKKDSETLLKP